MGWLSVIGSGRVGSGGVGLGKVGLVELGWVRLGWVGSGWVGLSWMVLYHRIFKEVMGEHRRQAAAHPGLGQDTWGH